MVDLDTVGTTDLDTTAVIEDGGILLCALVRTVGAKRETNVGHKAFIRQSLIHSSH